MNSGICLCRHYDPHILTIMYYLFSDRESEYSCALKFLTCVKCALREFGHIRGVGIILSLETEAAVLSKRLAALAGPCAVEGMGGGGLNAGKVCEDFHQSAA